MADPNDPLDPEPTPVPEPEPAPPAPQIDVEQAYDVIARTEGWDPRLTKYEIQEHKRRVQEFERERKEFERERSRQYQPPADDGGDPYMREIRETRREVREFIEGQRAEREREDRKNRLLSEVDAVYLSQARQAGMTKEQVGQTAEDFYAAMNDLYPEPSMLEAIGVERAARNAFNYVRTNGTRPAAGVNRINPRERVIIPSPQSGPGPGNPAAFDAASQRENETQEQYLERLTRLVRESNIGLNALPEGRKFSSG